MVFPKEKVWDVFFSRVLGFQPVLKATLRKSLLPHLVKLFRLTYLPVALSSASAWVFNLADQQNVCQEYFFRKRFPGILLP